MKKLIVTAVAACIATTAAFSDDYNYRIDGNDTREDASVSTPSVTLKNVPGYYKWLDKKKDGVWNASPWQQRKLAKVLKNASFLSNLAACTHMWAEMNNEGLDADDVHSKLEDACETWKLPGM